MEFGRGCQRKTGHRFVSNKFCQMEGLKNYMARENSLSGRTIVAESGNLKRIA